MELLEKIKRILNKARFEQLQKKNKDKGYRGSGGP